MRNGTRIQSVLVLKKGRSLQEARAKVQDLGLKTSKVDTSGKFFKFRQLDPKKVQVVGTITLTPTIKARVALPKGKTRKQIGIVTGGLALGTKAVASGVAKGLAVGTGKSVTAIGTPIAKGGAGLGRRLIVGAGKGIGKGIKIGAKGAGRRIKESAIRRLNEAIVGKQLDGKVIEELINQQVTDPDRITRNVFPPANNLKDLEPEQRNISLQIASISAGVA